MSDLKHTQRGFAYIEFQDRYDHKCSVQKSSLATEDAIWFGIDDANPQVLHGDAHRLGIETDATSGWVPYPLPAEVSLATRMHLTQDQVRELLPTLIHFAETGDVLAPADCRTQPEATAPAQGFDRDIVLTAMREIREASRHGETTRIYQIADQFLGSNPPTPLAQDLSAAIDKDAKIAAQRARILALEEQLARALETPVNDWCPECHARESSGDALSAGDRVDAVEGDLLPPVGSKVLIHLARQDEWVEHTVTGYYAWADLSGRYDVHRVFVRVVDAAGYDNARLLKDVRLQSQKGGK